MRYSDRLQYLFKYSETRNFINNTKQSAKPDKSKGNYFSKEKYHFNYFYHFKVYPR